MDLRKTAALFPPLVRLNEKGLPGGAAEKSIRTYRHLGRWIGVFNLLLSRRPVHDQGPRKHVRPNQFRSFAPMPAIIFASLGVPVPARSPPPSRCLGWQHELRMGGPNRHALLARSIRPPLREAVQFGHPVWCCCSGPRKLLADPAGRSALKVKTLGHHFF